MENELAGNIMSCFDELALGLSRRRELLARKGACENYYFYYDLAAIDEEESKALNRLNNLVKQDIERNTAI
ncbi:MAG: hypothetical protein AAC990_05890 [Dehalococcoides mccartyi]|jgi:hypothetical protein|uniref:Uncharacterized protein n=2 Tax=Dehalococcoides mccartyi TaxID=61435 RepID=A0A142V9L6_9CHLR|nr:MULTISPECIES: hypothetical protein [Dehalococcoides]AGG06327.1 hypothetical protein dcmb_706 [Dehalococcoides mccartyi DCMB5]AGG07758.1 hypothetical protein btf_660 [Dehalococcoides mccartyi BTF08]AII60791.1 hypothetical protein X794_02915 [Dehalococcoides mccartyi CG5]AMU86462.1 hypothetical protein Dm11a5_0636 [Dehalococcoides mccartyi]AOV99288.1 hypothetical protein DCWBC2_0635 [Dehalococcoides mccartyi]